MRVNGDLCAASLAALAAVAVVWAAPHSAARIVLGLPLVLFTPGYASLAALFPQRGDLRGIERLTLSFALSLAIVVLAVVVQDLLPWGLRPAPLAAVLAGVVVAASVLAGLSRARFPFEERDIASAAAVLRSAGCGSRRWVPIAAIVVVCAALVDVRFASFAPGNSEPFTEFSMAGPSGNLQAYPRQIRAGDPVRVLLGISNHELRRTVYTGTVVAEGRRLATFGPVELGNNQRWTQSMQFTIARPSSPERVDIVLFKDGGATPYRSLHLWLSVLPR